MPAAQAPANLKVALLLPTSGLQAQIGQACRRGADVANDVFADMKMAVKLDIVNYDTETKPDVARTQAEKAIDAGANMLVGAFDSGQTIAIAQVAEQRGIPLVVNIAAAPQITEQGYKFVVRNFPTAPMLITGALALHKEIFKVSGKTPKTAVLMSVNDTFGTAMINGIKALFPKLDMPYEIVETISYDPAAKDLSVEVGQGQGHQGRNAAAGEPPQRRQAAGPGDGEAALGADGRDEPRRARPLRAGFPQDHGQVRRLPDLQRAVARPQDRR